ncbi:Methionyl-tRNA formyltransferase [Orbilia ellipsospora]|uniref:methionyl-tRNA formyltransferase n=1 Tax=Orbilia ellipsospora TaxID=2528407 RepID=A0AAV9XAF0_9PEZI
MIRHPQRYRRLLQPCMSFTFPRGIHTGASLSNRLKILFCGSDNFSAESLTALQNLKDEHAGQIIESIDVLIKKEKPSGRGLKKRRQNPCQKVAEFYEMPFHTVDGSEGLKTWEFPKPIDLIVAVSFGFFIPARLIEGAKYGGVNVHPSFLPKYWGATPIHHALLKNDKSTGVVIQTLDKRKFDNGRILAKSDPFTISPPDPTIFTPPAACPDSPYDNLSRSLSLIGANLLRQTILNKSYDPAVHANLPEVTTGESKIHAPLLKKNGRCINWGHETAIDVWRRSMVYPGMFCYFQKLVSRDGPLEPPKRAKMNQFRMPTVEEHDKHLKNVAEGTQWVYIPDVKKWENAPKRSGSTALQVGPGEWVCVKDIVVEGKPKRDAKAWRDIDAAQFGFVGVSEAEKFESLSTISNEKEG